MIRKYMVLGVVVLAIAQSSLMADIRLASVFSDNMVLQREKRIAVWGWAAAGEPVTVSIAGKKAGAVADGAGAWKVKLGPFSAGGPHEMTVCGRNTVVLKNVLFGEVWLCSGQSNMQWPLGKAKNGLAEVAAATHSGIRLLTVRSETALKPSATVSPDQSS